MDEFTMERAALHALGALEGEALRPWQSLLADQDDGALKAQAAMREVVTLVAAAQSPARPLPAGLKDKVLARIRATPQAKPSAGADSPGFQFVLREEGEWFPAPVPGGRFKKLSLNPAGGYALLYLELPPGARFPEHEHVGHEEIYLLTGDAQTEGRFLKPGDFLHANPGSRHAPLYTEHGCTALLMVPLAALKPA
jgi:anti-sigma factor ChrR (cupin superfamily)